MTQSIGFLELNSIARGIGAADEMMKAADVTLLYARTNCPGKFAILVAGEVSAVDAAMAAGSHFGGGAVLEELVIPRLHPQVIRAVYSTSMPETKGALGILEFFNITGAISAGDTAVKAADVELLDIRLGTGLGGKSFVLLTGETAAVTQASEAGVADAREKGTLVDFVVIPNPTPELFDSLM